MRHGYLHSLAPVVIDEAGLTCLMEAARTNGQDPKFPLPFALRGYKCLLRYVVLR